MAEDKEEFDEFSKEADEQRRRQNFKDFIVLSKISGPHSRQSHSARIPREQATDSGKVVEIAKVSHNDESTDLPGSNFVVNRNSSNDIVSIVVECSCGKKTIIRFDLEESEGTPEESDIQMTEEEEAATVEVGTFEGQPDEEESGPKNEFGDARIFGAD